MLFDFTKDEAKELLENIYQQVALIIFLPLTAS